MDTIKEEIEEEDMLDISEFELKMKPSDLESFARAVDKKMDVNDKIVERMTKSRNNTADKSI